MKMPYKKVIKDKLVQLAACFYLEEWQAYELSDDEDEEIINNSYIARNYVPNYEVTRFQLIYAISLVSDIYNKSIEDVVNDVNSSSTKFDDSIVKMSWFEDDEVDK